MTRGKWLALRALRQHAAWRWARRLCVVVLVLLIAFSGFLHVRSALLTREIQAVVSGLQQLRIDETPEAEVRRLIPSATERPGRPTTGVVVRTFDVQVSNAFEEYDFPGIYWITWPVDSHNFLAPPPTSKWGFLSLPLWVAYALGWRHIAFEASVTVENGVVSGIEYHLEPDVTTTSARPSMVVVYNVQELSNNPPVRVSDIDDETPDFRFGPEVGYLASEYGVGSIGLAYTTEAPRELVSHAFELDLRCFWGLLGCSSARQVLPRLWADREAVIRAAASRLGSPNPCPDRILAGRVRRLSDLVVELREVTDPGLAGATSPAAEAASSRPGYRLKETIRGDAKRAPWVRYTREMYPQALLWRPDPVAPSLKVGDEVLVFLGVDFQSCRVVPATASAVAAVRSATPAPR